jgi:hypothetical protein
MIWDNPYDIFFSLSPSTGNLQGNKYYTNSVSGATSYYNKIIEHNNVIYICFIKSGSRIITYDMDLGSFTFSVEISGMNIYTILAGKLISYFV